MTPTKDPSSTAVVECFLHAMSRRDVVCAFPTAPGGPQEIRGRDTIRAFYTTLRPMWSTFSLTQIAAHALADDPERVVAKFASEGSLVDGSPYQNRYLALGTVRDGTKVRFGNCDFASAEGSLASASLNWAWYLISLKDYLDTGKGRPDTTPNR
jgi:ketosteroid isomerase-like protein